MVQYKVTTELETPLWLKFLRSPLIPRIWRKNRREEFIIAFSKDWYDKGEIINIGLVMPCKVLKRYGN
jgi:hypothetical protein